ncbi:O-antigen polymerase [uncultured Shewanella sp.]|uniref:O-antigen polymerase n=1 Tax=uncultured Shewanella sp. TaxID=173975 RepID=UPI002635CA17|nr:O-antigen polymerase [uncultured Shewanella sp.]
MKFIRVLGYTIVSLLVFLYFLNLSNIASSSKFILVISYFSINLIVIISVILYKNFFNPIVFVFPFLFGLFYYQFNLSYLQNELAFKTCIVIFVFFIAYFSGCILFRKSKFISYDVRVSYFFVNVFFTLGVIIFVVEAVINGGFAVIQTLQGSNAYIEKTSLPILHYFYMLLAILPSCYYYLYRTGKIGKFICIGYILVCTFMIFDSLSRQLILLLIFSLFFTYIRFNELSIDKQFFKLTISIGVFFILVGSLRYLGGGASDVDELEFMKAYAKISQEFNVNIFDITFNLYTAKNFSTLNDIVLLNDDKLHFGKYLFQAYIKIFKYNEAFNLQYNPLLDSYSLLGTIIADLYLDFGFFGVAVMSFLYGVLANYSYKSYINSKSLSSCLLISVVFYSLFMSPFTNYFNQLFVLLCFLFAMKFRYVLKV